MASKFTLDIARFVAKGKGLPRAVAKKVILQLGERIVEKTPVGDPKNWKRPPPEGYVGGRARGSWQYARGGPMQIEPGTIDKNDAKDNVAYQRIVAGVTSGDAADIHFITSTVPYMRALEYDAHSTQAPEGMVRKTVAEYHDFIENAIRTLSK